MFGLKQVEDFVSRTGRNVFTINEFAEALGISESSARRYLHEAERLGIIAGDNGLYRVDETRLVLVREALNGLNTTESLLRFLKALEKRGLIRSVSVRREERGVDVSVFRLVLGAEVDEKAISRLATAIGDPSFKALCVVVPSYLTTELFLLLKNRLSLPATSFVELTNRLLVVTFEREEGSAAV